MGGRAASAHQQAPPLQLPPSHQPRPPQHPRLCPHPCPHRRRGEQQQHHAQRQRALHAPLETQPPQQAAKQAQNPGQCGCPAARLLAQPPLLPAEQAQHAPPASRPRHCTPGPSPGARQGEQQADPAHGVGGEAAATAPKGAAPPTIPAGRPCGAPQCAPHHTHHQSGWAGGADLHEQMAPAPPQQRGPELPPRHPPLAR